MSEHANIPGLGIYSYLMYDLYKVDV